MKKGLTGLLTFLLIICICGCTAGTGSDDSAANRPTDSFGTAGSETTDTGVQATDDTGDTDDTGKADTAGDAGT